jgi:hypothetical protein
VIAIDPQAATRRFEQARRTRAVSVLDKHDGTAALWVRGPAEQTQLMYDEVARDARARRFDGDERSLESLSRFLCKAGHGRWGLIRSG